MINFQEDVLLCPSCGFNCTHIEDVYVAGRAREDGEVFPVHVDSHGRVEEGIQVGLPSSDVGRRHVIWLAGWCEGCGKHFGIEFKQHKGETYVRVLEKAWQPVQPS